MKFTVSYSRKVKAGKPYEMLEIGLSREHDDSWTDPDQAFAEVRAFVNKRIEEGQERLLKESVNRPEVKDR